MPTPDGPKYGRAECVPVQMLPELVFDFRDPADADPAFRPAGVPALVLTVRPPAGTPQPEVAAALEDLFLALREYEAELGGKGLVIEPAGGPPGAMVWRATTADPAGAADRVGKLAAALGQPAGDTADPSVSKVKATAGRLAGRFPVTAAVAA